MKQLSFNIAYPRPTSPDALVSVIVLMGSHHLRYPLPYPLPGFLATTLPYLMVSRDHLATCIDYKGLGLAYWNHQFYYIVSSWYLQPELSLHKVLYIYVLYIYVPTSIQPHRSYPRYTWVQKKGCFLLTNFLSQLYPDNSQDICVIFIWF